MMADGLPDADAVGALLRARTKDVNGAELGTFNEDTRPTGDEVDTLAQAAADEVYATLGAYDSLPDSMTDPATRLVALRTAMLVELSYFPEQVASDKSPFAMFEALYEKALPRLVEAVREALSDGAAQAGDAMLPLFGFPVNEGGMISNGTQW